MISEDTSIAAIATSIRNRGISVMDRVRAMDGQLRADHGYQGDPVKISWDDAPQIRPSDLDWIRAELDILAPSSLFERADDITVVGTGNTTATSLGRYSRWSMEEAYPEKITVYLNPASREAALPSIRDAIDRSSADYAFTGRKSRELIENYGVAQISFIRRSGPLNAYEGDGIVAEELGKLERALGRAESVPGIEGFTLRYSNRADYNGAPKVVKVDKYDPRVIVIPFGTPEDALVRSIAEALENERTIRGLEEDIVEELHANYNYNFSQAHVKIGPTSPLKDSTCSAKGGTKEWTLRIRGTTGWLW